MDYAQLVQLYFERSTALQNYWTLYVVIIGGLLAFSSLRQLPNRLTTILITVLFLCFAYKNCGALVDVTTQRAKVYTLLDEQGPSPVHAALRPTLVQTDEAGVRQFHYACDALTVAALWSMEWRRRVRANAAARAHADDLI